MPDSSEGLHDAPETLSTMARDMHRALISQQEELEAVDWYQQRAESCVDEDLRAVFEHNRREEIEHAAMLLEWLRRHDPVFAAHLRDDLFSHAPITDVEAAATEDPQPQPEEPRADSAGFTIGSPLMHAHNRTSSGIPDELWDRIDNTAIEAAKRLLTARRFMGGDGPFGVGLTSLELGDEACLDGGDGDLASIVLKIGQDLRVGFEASDSVHLRLFVSESLALLLDAPAAICTLEEA